MTFLPRTSITRVSARATLLTLLLALPLLPSLPVAQASAHSRSHSASARCTRVRGRAHRPAHCSSVTRRGRATAPAWRAPAPVSARPLEAEPVGAQSAQPEAASQTAAPAAPAPGGVYVPPPAFVAGGVVGWGENLHGQLAAGFHSRWLGNESLQLPSGVKEISLGMGGGLALTQSGTVYAWGGNVYGQDGLGYRNRYSLLPERVALPSGVVQIAATGSHSMALLANGTVMVWGSNLYGELGNGTSTHGREVAGDYVDLPQPVPGLHEAVYIATGGSTDVAVLKNGTVVGWGENSTYQLGDGTRTEKDTPVHVRGLENVKAITVGGFPAAGAHILAILADGTVMGTGRNDSGQLGAGNPEYASSAVPVRGLSGISSVSADISHSLALTSSGRLYAFGSNEYGQLGIGASPETCGTTPCSRNPVPVPLGPVTSASAGFRYSAAVSGGHVYTWGSNLQGQIGDGTTAQKNSPTLVAGVSGAGSVAASYYYTVAGAAAAGPAREAEMSRVGSALVLRWQGATVATNWHIAWRAAPNGSWSKEVILPPSARTYSITGLSYTTPVEVRLQSNPENVKVLQWGEAFPLLWPIHSILEAEVPPLLAAAAAPAAPAEAAETAQAPESAQATPGSPAAGAPSGTGAARTRRAPSRRARKA